MATKRPPFYEPLRAFFFVLKRERFFFILGITLVILFGGAISLYLLENKVNKTVDSFGDAIYWAIISMTTTGYGDITPATTAGRVVAAIVVLSGLVLLSIVTATVASVFVEKKIREGKGLETIKFKDHIVLCGWNNNAQEAVEGLIRSMPAKELHLVLVNELSEDEVESVKYKFHDHDLMFLRGDFTREDVLARANIVWDNVDGWFGPGVHVDVEVDDSSGFKCANDGTAGPNGWLNGINVGCDMVVAARSAGFIQAFSKIGLIPDCGGTWLLTRLVGRARALGLAMTGDKLPAEEAQRIGLIWQCVDDTALMDSAMALATRLASMPSKALAETRRALDAAAMLDYEGALALEARLQRDLGRAHDYGEGVAAFLDKRAPLFTDR